MLDFVLSFRKMNSQKQIWNHSNFIKVNRRGEKTGTYSRAVHGIQKEVKKHIFLSFYLLAIRRA